MKETELLAAALEYAELGNRVLPVYEILDDGTCACNPGGECRVGKPGKHPRIKAWQEQATTDEATVREWWGDWPNANIGVAVPAWYMVFDVDTKPDPDTGRIAHLDDLGEIPETVIARSGSDGWHVWFELPKEATLRGGKAMPGVDIRKLGNYVLVEPSRHVCGGVYRWEPDHSLVDLLPSPIPNHLLQLIEKPATTPLLVRSTPVDRTSTPEHWVEWAIEQVKAGAGRNDTGFGLACQLRDDGVNQDDAELWMLKYQAEVEYMDSPPYDAEEALLSLASAYSREPREAARSLKNGSAVARPSAVATGHTPSLPAVGSAKQGEESPLFSPPAPATLRASAGEEERRDSEATTTTTIHSIPIPFYSSRTGGERDELMRRIEEADAMPMDAQVRFPGTPAWHRRQAQYAVLREAWALLFPQDQLPKNQMNTWLCLFEQGDEGEMLLDAIFCAYDSPHNGPIRSPRKYINDCLLNATDPARGDKRRAQAQTEQKAQWSRKPRGEAQPANTEPKVLAQPAQAQPANAVTLADVARLYKEAGFDYDQDSPVVSPDHDESTAVRKQLSFLEALKKQPRLAASRLSSQERAEQASA